MFSLSLNKRISLASFTQPITDILNIRKECFVIHSISLLRELYLFLSEYLNTNATSNCKTLAESNSKQSWLFGSAFNTYYYAVNYAANDAGLLALTAVFTSYKSNSDLQLT